MKRLEALGINGYEGEVYAALVSLGRARVNELARRVTVPRPHIYTALRSLARRGLVTSSKGRVSVFSAVAPEAAFRGYIAAERSGLEAKEAAVRELEREFRSSADRVEEREAIEVLGSKSAPFHDVQRHIAAARKEVLSAFGFPAPGKDAKQQAVADRLELEVLGRGVRVRCLYSRAALGDEAERRRMELNLAAGEEARVIDEVPMNLIVVDDTLAAFSLVGPDGGPTVFRFNDRRLVRTQRLAFEEMWRRAEKAGPARRAGSRRPAARQARKSKGD